MNDRLLSELNQFLNDGNCNPDWQSLEAGSSNRLYSASSGGRRYIARINANEDLAFGVSREREARILELTRDMSWMPTVVRNDWQAGWCLMQWHGVPPKPPLANPLRQQLLDAVDRWQKLPMPDEAVLKTDYQGLFESYRPQLQGLPIGNLLVQLVDLVQLLIHRLPAVTPCLTHHDLHLGNTCVDQQSLIVIDWEYAGIGNPWFDAAALADKFSVNERQIGRLHAFSRLSQSEISRGLKQARWLAATLECLWYWARGLSGSKMTTAELMRTSLQLLKTRPVDPDRRF
ncbi:phosphotransferase [Marinobacterium jannaschii]|uniref:phosphotransferase n=1 Tax=Marinobacterium jannaschii TaxID=64970 RepID=UPI00048313DB|nr:phosphotransferase [Marinobacterium jannaschii]